jgi:hypothetical protein
MYFGVGNKKPTSQPIAGRGQKNTHAQLACFYRSKLPGYVGLLVRLLYRLYNIIVANH